MESTNSEQRSLQETIVEQQQLHLHRLQRHRDRCSRTSPTAAAASVEPVRFTSNPPTPASPQEKYGQDKVDFSRLDGTYDMDKIGKSIPAVGHINGGVSEVYDDNNNTTTKKIFDSLVTLFKKGSGQVIPIDNKAQMTVIHEVFNHYAKWKTGDYRYRDLDLYFKELDSFVNVLKRALSTSDSGIRVPILFCLFHAIDVIDDKNFSRSFVEEVIERFPNIFSLNRARIYYDNNLVAHENMDAMDECLKHLKQRENMNTLLMRHAMFCLRPSTFSLFHSLVPPECVEEYYDIQCFLDGMEGAHIDERARHMETILESLPASPCHFSKADSRFVYLYVSVMRMTSFSIKFNIRLMDKGVVNKVLDLINRGKIVPKSIMPFIGRGMGYEEEREYVFIQDSGEISTVFNPSMFRLKTFSKRFKLTKNEEDLASLLSCMKEANYSLLLLRRVIYETGYANYGILSSLTKKLIDVSGRLENTDKVFDHESFKEEMDKLSPEGYVNLYRLSGNTVPRIDFVKMLCSASNGHNALINLLKDSSSMTEQEDLFALAARLTILANRDDGFHPMPCRHISMLIENFPDLCHIPRLDFGIVRLCVESGVFLHNIMDMKEIKKTVDRKYEFYGGATALCFSHNVPDYMVRLMIMGADPRILTKSGENALHFMARSGANDVFNKLPIDRDPVMLERMREAVEVRRKVDAATPLMVAVAHGNTQSAISLVEKLGARCNTPFGMAGEESIRTVDAVLLLGQHDLSKNLMRRGIMFSKKFISKAAIEGILEDVGSEIVPEIKVSATGLLVDYDNYKKSDGVYSLPSTFPLLMERGRWHFKPIDGKTFVSGSKRILDAVQAGDYEELRNMVSEGEYEERLAGSEFGEEMCPICLVKWNESVEDGKEETSAEPASAVSSSLSYVSILKGCGHSFHTQCISRLLSNLCPPICPICRCPFDTIDVHVWQ